MALSLAQRATLAADATNDARIAAAIRKYAVYLDNLANDPNPANHPSAARAAWALDILVSSASTNGTDWLAYWTRVLRAYVIENVQAAAADLDDAQSASLDGALGSQVETQINRRVP